MHILYLLNLLFKEITVFIIDLLVEAKIKSKKALYMSDLSSTEETVSANKRHKEIIISSPTLSTNSCPLFSGNIINVSIIGTNKNYNLSILMIYYENLILI